MNHSNKYCHLAHDDGQQQQAVAAAATAVQQHTTEQQQTYVTGIHKYIHVRRAAAYSTIIIRQVKVLCFETAHGVYVTKRGTAVITTHSRVAAAAAAAALCMHIKLASHCSDDTSIIIVHIVTRAGANKKSEMSHKKTRTSWIRTTHNTSKGQQPTCSPTKVLT